MRLLRITTALSLVLACSMEPRTSHVRLHLTDAPGPDLESAVVWISGAFLVPGDEAGPVVVTDEAQEFDLLLLQDGVTALLGDATVPASRYAQLRLVVDSARLTLVAGVTFDDGTNTKLFKVPSGSIKVSFPGQLDLTEDAEVVVDFDVASNFVFQGPSSGPYRVLFTPTLKGSVQPSQP